MWKMWKFLYIFFIYVFFYTICVWLNMFLLLEEFSLFPEVSINILHYFFLFVLSFIKFALFRLSHFLSKTGVEKV